MVTDTMGPSWWSNPKLRQLNVVLLGIITIQITAGYDQVVVGSFLAMDSWIEIMGNPSSSQTGLITTATFIGALLGSIPASFCADRLGRKIGLLIGSISAILGSIIQMTSFGYPQFTVGRATLGVGLAFNAVSGPSLIAELAHPNQRGSVLGFFNNLWYVGSLIAAWTSFGTGHLTSTWSWRIPSLLQLLPSIFLLFILPYIPESPRFLSAIGKHGEAMDILAKYHANGDREDILVRTQLRQIRRAIADEAIHARTSWSVLWRTTPNLKRTCCAISVGFVTIWSGQAIISYYFAPILTQVGITGTTKQIGINGGMQVWNLAFSIAGAFLAESIGRRALWITSLLIMICANIGTIASSAMASQDPRNSNTASYLVIVFLFLYNAGFNIGCNPLTYAYPTEILPYEIRTKGLAVYVFVAYALATLNIYVNPIAIARIAWRYWAVYLALLFLWLAIVYFTYPETRGLTLEGSGQLFEQRNAADIDADDDENDADDGSRRDAVLLQESEQTQARSTSVDVGQAMERN